MGSRILIVEDEADIAAFIKKGLVEDGFDVTVAYDGKQGLSEFLIETYDMLILDVILPHINGRDLCMTIREQHRSKVPILMLTALGDTREVVKGLEAGADDYLLKPFKFAELLARVRALLRRSQLFGTETSEKIVRKGVELDPDSKQVKYGGSLIELTAKEYHLLAFFMSHPNKVFTRADLLDHVWGLHFDPQTNIVEVYINYIRTKIDKRFNIKLIETMKGLGYILRS